jgi:hypothetical protein
MSIESRVTRFGRLFSLASLLKISKVAQILGLLFSTVPARYVLILTKNWLGFIFGDFFKKTHLVTLIESQHSLP